MVISVRNPLSCKTEVQLFKKDLYFTEVYDWIVILSPKNWYFQHSWLHNNNNTRQESVLSSFQYDGDKHSLANEPGVNSGFYRLQNCKPKHSSWNWRTFIHSIMWGLWWQGDRVTRDAFSAFFALVYSKMDGSSERVSHIIVNEDDLVVVGKAFTHALIMCNTLPFEICKSSI